MEIRKTICDMCGGDMGIYYEIETRSLISIYDEESNVKVYHYCLSCKDKKS